LDQATETICESSLIQKSDTTSEFIPEEFIKMVKKETTTKADTIALAKKICEDLDINNTGALDIHEFDLM